MTRLTTIELYKEKMKFSAGHFTIFSANHREPLHGHNYTVYAAITTRVNDNGLTFDYRIFKQRLCELCKALNSTFLLPQHSPHMNIKEDGDYYYCHFANEKLPFLKKDVTLLPIANVTVEELSHLLLQRLLDDNDNLEKYAIQAITIKVFSGPGQNGSSTWENLDKGTQV